MTSQPFRFLWLANCNQWAFLYFRIFIIIIIRDDGCDLNHHPLLSVTTTVPKPLPNIPTQLLPSDCLSQPLFKQFYIIDKKNSRLQQDLNSARRKRKVTMLTIWPPPLRPICCCLFVQEISCSIFKWSVGTQILLGASERVCTRRQYKRQTNNVKLFLKEEKFKLII